MKQGKVFFDIESGLDYSGEDPFYVSKSGVIYPVKFHEKPNSKSLIVFFPGMNNRGGTVPVFMRSTFAEHLESDILILSDPAMIYNDEITIAWFAGNRDTHFAADLGVLIENYIKKKNSYKNIILYGTSAGGIPALNIAMIIKSAPVTTVIGNAQTNAFKYWRKFIIKMSKAMIGTEDINEIEKIYSERINRNSYKCSHNLIFTQNIDDKHHYENHYLPFIKTYHGPGEASFIEYSDHELGHNPLPKETEIKILKSIMLGNKKYEEEIPNIKKIRKIGGKSDYGYKYTIEKSKVTAEIDDNNETDNEFAFYLIADGKRIKSIWYQLEKKISFEISNLNRIKKLSIVFFVKKIWNDNLKSIETKEIVLGHNV
ncbi:hypothetical protein NBV64_05895 [Alcaligenes sp. DN25]|uniref:hypothetical protein n=1 Tax=Alcaligenes TaxID=507 RepID=UPI00202F50A3|nr:MULTISPECIES: hypothetical protein [Alcaligenes]URW83884.1 hypothetical protein NBV64_05895 [Alcaligenes sp. DN25]WEA68722.1 hypothetical protein PWH35_05905 [Alcaligenes faecalis]